MLSMFNIFASSKCCHCCHKAVSINNRQSIMHILHNEDWFWHYFNISNWQRICGPWKLPLIFFNITSWIVPGNLASNYQSDQPLFSFSQVSATKCTAVMTCLNVLLIVVSRHQWWYDSCMLHCLYSHGPGSLLIKVIIQVPDMNCARFFALADVTANFPTPVHVAKPIVNVTNTICVLDDLNGKRSAIFRWCYRFWLPSHPVCKYYNISTCR